MQTSLARHRCRGWLRLAWIIGCLACSRIVSAQAGRTGSPQRELPNPVTVDEIDVDARRHLERFQALLRRKNWSEALDALTLAVEEHPDRLAALTPRLAVNVGDYSQLLIAGLPPEAMELYRDRVEPQARKWFEQGLARRDARLLRKVVEQAFCSRWGDDALNALAELALERGDFGQARSCWQMLVETPPAQIDAGVFESLRQSPQLGASDAALLDGWYLPAGTAPERSMRLRRDAHVPEAANQALVSLFRPHGISRTRLAYPGCELARAEVFARLILVSILEGSRDRAQRELAGFAQEFGAARGRLGGREVNLADELRALLAASDRWARPSGQADWPTFAGSQARLGAVPQSIDVGPVLWKRPLGAAASSNHVGRDEPQPSQRGSMSPYHPVVVGGLVLVSDQSHIHAWKLANGEVAFGGAIDTSDGVLPSGSQANSEIGQAAYTLTALGDTLFARMGSGVAVQPRGQPSGASYLVCLDLAAEGRLNWKSAALEEGWAFDGTPVGDGESIYVLVRRRGVQSQAHIACFEAETGREKWRRFLAASETAGADRSAAASPCLLTLAGESLYVTTNLGAIAAIDTQTGRIHWVHRYPRSVQPRTSPGAAEASTSVTPCIYDRGRLFVAAADLQGILALDAATGLVLWENEQPESVTHLLGVGCGRLWASSGERLWALSTESGAVDLAWPQAPSTMRVCGRGLLAGDHVYLPTGTEIYVFDQESALPARPPIELSTRGATGGNLALVPGRLLIATQTELIALQTMDRPGSLAAAALPTDTPRVRTGLVTQHGAAPDDSRE